MANLTDFFSAGPQEIDASNSDLVNITDDSNTDSTDPSLDSADAMDFQVSASGPVNITDGPNPESTNPFLDSANTTDFQNFNDGSRDEPNFGLDSKSLNKKTFKELPEIGGSNANTADGSGLIHVTGSEDPNEKTPREFGDLSLSGSVSNTTPVIIIFREI